MAKKVAWAVPAADKSGEPEIDLLASVVRLAIDDAELGSVEAMAFLADVMPDWRLRRVGLLQPDATMKEKATMDTIDYDEPVDELGGLSRNEFAVAYSVDARFILAPETPETDARKQIGDALGIDWRYIPSDVLLSEGANNVRP